MNISSTRPTDGPSDFRWKRVYDPPAAGDGTRILIDRLWPRGMKKENLRIDAWMKDISPSPALRMWFGHLPERWKEFRKRYDAELRQLDPTLLQDLADKARRGPVTFLIAARDPDHNHAIVLTDFLRKRFASKTVSSRRRAPKATSGTAPRAAGSRRAKGGKTL